MEVISGSLADHAGIQENDILVSIGGEKIKDSAQLKSAWERYSSGNIIEMELLRSGSKYTVKITKDSSQKFGATFASSSPAGVLITEVFPGSAAEKAGLQAGDLICGFAEKAISTSIGLNNTLGKFRENETVELAYLRDGYKETTHVKLDADDLGVSEAFPSFAEVKTGDSVPLFTVKALGSLNESNSIQWLKTDADFFIGLSSGKKDEDYNIYVETVYDESTGIYTSTLYGDNIRKEASGTYKCSVHDSHNSSMETAEVTLKVN